MEESIALFRCELYLVFPPVADDALQLFPPHLPEVCALGERLDTSVLVLGRRHPLDAAPPAAERGGLFPHGSEPREPAPGVGGRRRGISIFGIGTGRSGDDPIVRGDAGTPRSDRLRQGRFRAANCLRICGVVRHSRQFQSRNHTHSLHTALHCIKMVKLIASHLASPTILRLRTKITRTEFVALGDRSCASRTTTPRQVEREHWRVVVGAKLMLNRQ